MINFAGKDLLFDDRDGELSHWMRSYQPLCDTRIIAESVAFRSSNRRNPRRSRSNFVGIPRPNWPACPPLRLNQLYWPTGAGRWAFFLGLADTATKDAILKIVGPQYATQLKIGDSRIRLADVASDGFTQKEITGPGGDRDTVFALSTGMYLLPPRPVSVPEMDQGRNGLWLLPLVDERYHWQFRHTDEFAPATWADAFADLFTQLNNTPGTHDAIDADYCPPDSVEMERRFENAAAMLDVVAMNVGQRVVRKINGNVESQTYATAETAHLANAGDAADEPFAAWCQVAGGEFNDQADGSIRPANVTVTFPNEGDTGVGTETNAATDTDNSFGLTKVIRTTSIDGRAGNVALAAQIATDYYGWLNRRHDITYIGVKPWDPTGYDDHVLWSMGTRQHNGEYKADTRIQSLPYNFGIDEMLHECP